MIRLSGEDALAIAGRVFRGADLAVRPSHSAVLGTICDPDTGEAIDQVVLTIFRAPRSYTGDDVVEISCHGSAYIARRIVEVLIATGARAAQAGEFTIRAFLAGKLDLAQAEGVADMIAATDRASHTLALNQLRGGYSSQFAALREQLVELAALLELELDFSEEEVEFADRTRLGTLIAQLQERVRQLSSSFRLGNALREGVPVAIVGEPNVGKSTLLNALLCDDRAMTSDIAGTTRDVIEESRVIDGIRFRFLDTAGLRATSDALERMGIERTRRSIERASIVLWVVERFEAGMTPPFELTAEQHPGIVINKIDRLSPAESEALLGVQGVIPISARVGINMEALTRFLTQSVGAAPLYNGSTIVSHARHHEALLRTGEALERAAQGISDDLPADLLAQDIRQATHHLGTITGAITSEDILSDIFSKFCIGK